MPGKKTIECFLSMSIQLLSLAQSPVTSNHIG